MIDVVLKHAFFLDDTQKEKIMSSNALAFFHQFNF